jgi:MoaA/NifB/PqqE/SkfB family radical SAM enzyme
MQNAHLRTLVKTGLRQARYFMYYTNFCPFPFRVQVDLTDRCNFLCPTCSKWKVKPGKELTGEEWREVFMKLKNKTLTRRIAFGGGEATLRKDICDIIRYAREAGLSTSMVTNGFLLNQELLKGLDEAGLEGLVISLNGVERETHDPTRGVEGSFDKIMSVLPTLKAYNFKANLETIIMGVNIDQIVPLARFAKEQGLYGIHYQVLADVNAHYALIKDSMPEGASDWYEESSLWIRDPGKAVRAIRQLIQMQKNGYAILNPPGHLKKMIRYYTAPDSVKDLACLGGVSTFYVDPYGEVRICYGFDPIGNIKESDPIALWRSGRARAIRRNVKKCDRMCRLLNNNY